jgi:tetratricopeptide (TPR) repeat protein
MRCLQRVTAVANHQLSDALREASELGLIMPLVRAVYRFSHALIGSALRDELNAGERASIHLKIGGTLEEIYQTDVDPHLAELAHHFVEGGDAHKAIEYSIRAGEAARAVFAYEEAAAHWQAALDLMPTSAGAERRAQILERLGDLLDLTASRGAEFLKQSALLYETTGDVESAARVRARIEVSAVGENLRIEHSPAPRITEPETQSSDLVLWARTSISNAYDLASRGRLARSFALIDTVSDVVSGITDAVTIIGILSFYTEMYIWLMDPAQAQARLAHESAKLPLPEMTQFKPTLDVWLYGFNVERGDLREPNALSIDVKQEPVVEAERAFYRGEWERAEAILVKALGHARLGERDRRSRGYSQWLARVKRALGEYEAAEAILVENLALAVRLPHVAFELHAREELILLYGGNAQIQKADPHRARCYEVIAAGEDWRGLGGNIARGEAVLAAVEGRFEEASAQFATAVEIYRRYEMPFEEAETLHWWGRALLAASDDLSAHDRFDAAIEIYRRHRAGERWVERVRADAVRPKGNGIGQIHKPEVQAVRSPIAEGEQTEPAAFNGVFRKEGEYWTVSWIGRETRLKPRKGFDYIARLLRHPGQEIPASDLIKDVTITYRLGDGAILDSRGKAEYKSRIDDLRAQLEIAMQNNDFGGAEQARRELELVQSEIIAAVGPVPIGPHPRRALRAERARLAVTKAIKAALTRIRAADPELGRHLSLSIRTGFFCSYQPKQSVHWQV